MKPFSSFLKENQPMYLEDTLLSVIEYTPYTVHMKTADTKKYVFANQKYAQFKSFDSSDQLIGLTLEDLPFFKEDKLFSDTLTSVNAQDFYVINSKIGSRERRSTSNKEGMLRIDDTVKLPLLGQNQKVVAVMTLGCSVIPNLKLEQIFDFYLKHYLNAKKAIPYFLKFLKSASYFVEPPTLQELRVLMKMRVNSTYKMIASALGVSVDTVSFYIQSLKRKLKIQISLDQLVFHLRQENFYDTF